MNKRFSNLDLMICAASELYVEKELQDFINVDTSDIEPFLRRKHELRRLSKRSYSSCWRHVKIAAVACLICLSMAFTACICIPDIRSAIWNVVIDWYEDHIGIRFEPEEENEANDSNKPEQSVILNPPDKIEEKAYPSYLPGAYKCEIDLDSSGMYMMSFYDLNTGEWSFMIQQSIIHEREQFADSEDQTVETIMFDDFEAIIVTSTDQPGFYSLVWQDAIYAYMISGYFDSVNSLLSIASGIKLQ